MDGLIDGRYAGWETSPAPDRVYVPGRRNGANIDFELYGTEDGRLALPVYSTLDGFTHCCGDGRPWVAIKIDRVEDCAALCGAHVVVWDVAVPEGAAR